MRPASRLDAGMKHRQSGIGLVEIMIAMLLGLIVITGVISVVSANGQAYRTNAGLAQVQESARTGFELLARRIREAGTTGCGNINIANTVNNADEWWQLDDWIAEPWNVIRGFQGDPLAPVPATGPVGDRVPGTDALLLQGLDDIGRYVTDHNPPAAQFKINAATTEIANDDILMVCDFDHAAIFQVTNYNSSNRTIVHNTGTGTIGNCSKGLGFPTDCGSVTGNAYQYGPNSLIARFATELWYVGWNGRPDEGGRSLFRQRLAGGATTEVTEFVAGVTDLQVRFRENAETEFEEDPDAWGAVTAVEATLTVASTDARVSVDSAIEQGRLQRSFTTIVGLRNRLQ